MRKATRPDRGAEKGILLGVFVLGEVVEAQHHVGRLPAAIGDPKLADRRPERNQADGHAAGIAERITLDDLAVGRHAETVFLNAAWTHVTRALCASRGDNKNQPQPDRRPDPRSRPTEMLRHDWTPTRWASHIASRIRHSYATVLLTDPPGWGKMPPNRCCRAKPDGVGLTLDWLSRRAIPFPPHIVALPAGSTWSHAFVRHSRR